MVWDRYLGYGAAVGATHLTSAVLDLGMGNRELVWSSFGGTWHRVRVRYPRVWSRYGRTPAKLILRAVIAIVVGGVLLRFAPGGLDSLPDIDGSGRQLPDAVTSAVLAVGVLLIVSGLYRLARTLVDLATERTITGEVLWLEVWLSTSNDSDSSTPWLHYLAVDDGTDDRTTAWGLPSEWANRCHDGDTVTIRVRPWTRRVVDITVVGHGQARELVEPPTGDIAAPARPALSADLLTVDEVARALGRPVRAGDSMALGGVLGGAQFLSADRGKPLLLVQALTGTPARWAWRANSRGQALPGIGDGAYASGDRAALRVGETTVVFTLMGEARDRQAYLPWLAAQCAARLAAHHS
ncbi:hypothetical protein [Phytohabitans flavus]|uniref:hypothetical protein n=1 Tax=Phytohabitans flavus TaxID=1076124 RepID=UPI002F969567